MVQHALERGHEAVGVCREQDLGDLDALWERVSSVRGSANDREVIGKAFAGCDAALTALVPRGVQRYAPGRRRR